MARWRSDLLNLPACKTSPVLAGWERVGFTVRGAYGIATDGDPWTRGVALLTQGDAWYVGRWTPRGNSLALLDENIAEVVFKANAPPGAPQ